MELPGNEWKPRKENNMIYQVSGFAQDWKTRKTLTFCEEVILPVNSTYDQVKKEAIHKLDELCNIVITHITTVDEKESV